MLGLFIAFLLSWLILFIVFKEHISVLGIIPNANRLKILFSGLLVMALFSSINFLGQSYFKGNHLIRNPDFGFHEALFALRWTAVAAMMEELIFRGAILYFLIKKIGPKWACILSAIAFGIYHWFSYSMFGRGLIPMAYVFILTGASGWMFAYSFVKSKSILIPFGLHFGWILMRIVFFSDGPLGESLFIEKGNNLELGPWLQLAVFLWQAVFVPVIISLAIKNYYHVKAIK